LLRTIQSPAENPAQEASVREFKFNTARKLNSLRCPDHGQAPRVQFHGATIRDITVQLSGCCGKLIEMANKAIAERSQEPPRPSGR
jgi:hypothetical protein